MSINDVLHEVCSNRVGPFYARTQLPCRREERKLVRRMACAADWWEMWIDPKTGGALYKGWSVRRAPLFLRLALSFTILRALLSLSSFHMSNASSSLVGSDQRPFVDDQQNGNACPCRLFTKAKACRPFQPNTAIATHNPLV